MKTQDRFRLVYDMQLLPERMPILDWLEAGGWCTHIASRPEAPDAMLEEVRRRGWIPVVTMLAHPVTRARQWTRWGLPVPDVDSALARYRRMFGDQFVWEVFTEDDSAGVSFPQVLLREQPGTGAEANAFWEAYVSEAMAVADRHGGIERWGRSGYATATHSLAARGLDCVLVERANDDVEDLQTGMAFARGAARQSGCEWGVDFSLWWGVINGCVQDLPALFHKRCLYLAYFGGAASANLEGGDLLYDIAADAPPAAGRMLEEFGRFTRRVPRGEVETPVAVMLPEGHGWMTPAYWNKGNGAWNYARVPYRQGMRGVDGFFATAFPGSTFAMDPFPCGRYESDTPPASPFALSCVTPEFAPRPENVYWAEPPIPFGRYHDRDQAGEDFNARQLETSPYRPMGDSRWGGIIDVLTHTAPGEVLARYEVLVLLGPVVLDTPLRARLEDHLERGGTLVVAAGVAGPRDMDPCGVAIQPELRAGRAWQWQGDPWEHEAFRYCPAEPCEGTEVLARASGGEPLVTRAVRGRGTVYTCLVPWYEGEGVGCARVARRLFDEAIGLVQPVRVSGLPVQWLSARHDGHYTVVVTNNDGAPWRGLVSAPRVPGAFTHCEELLTGLPVPFERAGTSVACELTVPPYEVRAVRWKAG